MTAVFIFYYEKKKKNTNQKQNSNPTLKKITWEKGSSSELGKSYWLRSLRLKMEGPECWGADSGGILGFFSYFLLVRIASVFSGCKWCGEKQNSCLQDSLNLTCSQTSKALILLVSYVEAPSEGIDMQMKTRGRWPQPPSPQSNLRHYWPLPVWTDSNSTGISQVLFSP